MGALIVTDEMAQELFREYCDGVTMKELAEQYKIHRTTISAAFSRRGLEYKDIKPIKKKKRNRSRRAPTAQRIADS